MNRNLVAIVLVSLFFAAHAPAADKDELRVVAAEWRCGGRKVNVTPIFKAQLKDGRIEVDVTTKLFGDIGEGPKELLINYTIGGKLQIGHYKEGAHISIASPSAPPLPPVLPKPAAGTTEQPLVSNEDLARLHALAKEGKNATPTDFGFEIKGDGEVRTGNKLSLPVRIDVTAATDSTNIRLVYGEKGVVIFNWEMNQEELRYHHPDNGSLWAAGGKGRLPTNQWIHISWIIEPTRSTIIVDGQTRAVVEGHYAGLAGTAGIQTHEATMDVAQLDFRELPAVITEGPIAEIKKVQTSIMGLSVMTGPSGEGLGQASQVILTATRGNPTDGTAVSFVTPVGSQMQAVLDDVIRAVHVKYPRWGATKVELSFEDRGSKDGPSIGAVVGTLLLSMIQGYDIDPKLAMTGDVTADGKIRAIGGVAAKVRGADADQCKLVAIPGANFNSLVDAVIYEGPSLVTNVQVLGIDRLDDAVALARTDRDAKLSEAIQSFESLQTIIKKFPDRVRTKDSQDRLAHILDLAPNHFSAKLLLMIAQNKLPRRLSAGASMYYMFVAVNVMLPSLYDQAKAVDPKQVTPAVVQAGLQKLRKTRAHADPKIIPLIDAWSDFIETYNAIELRRKPPAALEPKRQALLEAARKVDADRALAEKLLREGV